MSARIANAARHPRRLFGVGASVCALMALTLAIGLPGSGPVSASGQGAQEDHFYTDASVPASDVMMLGSSPREAPAETWGIGKVGLGSPNYVIVRYVAGEGWTRAHAILDESGQPLAGFVPAKGVLAGQIAPDGAGALAGFVGKSEVLLVRNPGGPFQETSPEPVPEEGEGAVLLEGEGLFAGQEPLIAALEEGSAAGALVVPAEVGESKHPPEPSVLHWEGQARRWTREPVELPGGDSPGAFKPIAIAASSPANAWLLAHVSTSSEAVSLFRREPGSGGSPGSWKPVSPGGGQEAGAPLTAAGEPVTDEAEADGQPLTVTEQGVWVDGEHAPSKSVTVFFTASGSEPDRGEVRASWCNVEGCSHPLPEPEELPAGEYRSFAWPSPSGEYGERVITGLPDGVILRLQGEQFIPVPTIGDPQPPGDVGGSKGAAFSTALEGWLGDEELAVHATPETEVDRLEYWPAPFHKPLLAIAAEPGVPVGASSSEALAVGEGGEVARYLPGEGWQPESLFEASGRRGEPQLHGVAWPTPNRAYAVGARGERFGVVGEMWLWRGETGLWEPDPAAPVNLRANLLGIAFAPGEPARGYVVGQGGTLMRYGKTWTQEAICQAGVPQPCLPAEVSGASFTAVAFAGSEALVAYRVPHIKEGAISYTGGVLANSGSGWRIDTEVAAALPAGYVPWTVAGLPDGGAGLSAAVPGGLQAPLVLERDAPGSAWAATPEPYPGDTAPASLALFREGEALRVVGSGAIPNTIPIDDIIPPPAGFPPNLAEPYPLGLATGVIRQTAAAWSDEEHERRILRPPGGFDRWDIPYNPDPTAAILLSESGSSGWAVGGLHTSREGSDTADIARYPGDGTRPPGFETYSIAPSSTANATFAVGGGAQCAAPCAELANARIGPDVWLASALARAREVDGLRAFLYTGPRVSTGAAAHPTLAIPYARELERYAALLAGGPEHTLVAASRTERDHGSECAFDETLTSFTPGLSGGECATQQTAYYAFTSEGSPTVRVIVLDDSGGIEGAQLEWLETQLAEARAKRWPALVVGSADLPEEDAGHEANAEAVTAVLVAGGAAAYVFDAPEENVSATLSSGGESILALGSGTLGYMNAINSENSNFIGAAGFLLVEVGGFDSAAELEPNGSVVKYTPVNPHLIPNIEELSLDAHRGVLLRRSEAALFSALARRPRAGGDGSGSSSENEASDFIPLSSCQGADCEHGILPEFKFTSSEPDVGRFVEPNLQLGPEEVKLAHEEPIPDEERARNYPLFCAFNAGTTTVTIEAGGLKASVPVKVEAGSVRRPCGTTPIAKATLKGQEQSVSAPVQPQNAAPTGPASTPPVVPVPPVPAVLAPPPPARPPALPPQFLRPLVPALLPAVIVPPPLPPAAEPTPPSGTSAVTSPVEAAQREEEEEEATESVSAQAVAYRQGEHEPSPAYLLGLIALAAFAGATIRRRPGRGERGVRVAPATLSTVRSQRRLAARRRSRW